jgi:diguanylate cyclase (GGDEF)-like protein
MQPETAQSSLSTANVSDPDTERFKALRHEAQEVWDRDPQLLARNAREMLELGRKLDNPEFTAVGSRFLGIAHTYLNETIRALPHSLEALESFRQLGNDRQVAAVQIELGNLYSELGDYIEATNYFEQSIATSAYIGSQNGKLVSLLNLAHLHRKLQNYEKSLSYTREALQIARELEDDEFTTNAWGLEGELHVLIGQQLSSQGETPSAAREFQLAQTALEHAHRLLEKLEPGLTVHVEVLIPYANLKTIQQDFEGANTLISQAQQTAERSSSPGQLARCLNSLGTLELQRGNLEAARAHLERAQSIFEKQNMKAELAQVYRDLSGVSKARGDFAAALETFERFHELDSSLRTLAAEHRAQALAVKLDLERTKRESELHQLRSTELAQLNERLQTQTKLLDRQAREDSLTGLANRRHLEEYAFEAFGRAKDRGEPLTLVIADIDNFKQINDSLSHALGDQVLQIVASILRSHCRRGDLAARYGGEEFVLVLSKADARDAWHICERVRQAVRQHPWASIHPKLKVTISLGFSNDLSLENHERMLAVADERLYEAKRAGRNCTRPELK